MCTELKGKGSWFLPFNQGLERWRGKSAEPRRHQDGLPLAAHADAGGTDGILENYAQIVEEKDEKTGRKKRVQIFPRYHQLDVVRKLLADAADRGGQAYLIQHSAGSGKSTRSRGWRIS